LPPALSGDLRKIRRMRRRVEGSRAVPRHHGLSGGGVPGNGETGGTTMGAAVPRRGPAPPNSTMTAAASKRMNPADCMKFSFRGWSWRGFPDDARRAIKAPLNATGSRALPPRRLARPGFWREIRRDVVFAKGPRAAVDTERASPL